MERITPRANASSFSSEDYRERMRAQLTGEVRDGNFFYPSIWVQVVSSCAACPLSPLVYLGICGRWPAVARVRV